MSLGIQEGWKIEAFDQLLKVRKGKAMIILHKKLSQGMSFLPYAEEIKNEIKQWKIQGAWGKTSD
jgi:hypothetical protein